MNNLIVVQSVNYVFVASPAVITQYWYTAYKCCICFQSIHVGKHTVLVMYISLHFDKNK